VINRKDDKILDGIPSDYPDFQRVNITRLGEELAVEWDEYL